MWFYKNIFIDKRYSVCNFSVRGYVCYWIKAIKWIKISQFILSNIEIPLIIIKYRNPVDNKQNIKFNDIVLSFEI